MQNPPPPPPSYGSPPPPPPPGGGMPPSGGGMPPMMSGGGGAMAVPGNLASPGMRIVGGLIDVVILIVTPHWLGVETPDGQRGWLPQELLEQLP